MNYKKTLFLLTFLISIEPLQASFAARFFVYARNAKKSAEFAAKKVFDKTKRLQSKIDKAEVESMKVEINNSVEGALKDSNVSKKMSDKVRNGLHLTKSGMFGTSESVVVENVQINHHVNHHAPKAFNQSFFEWMENGSQKRAVAVGLVLGAAGGYTIGHYVSPPKVSEK